MNTTNSIQYFSTLIKKELFSLFGRAKKQAKIKSKDRNCLTLELELFKVTDWEHKLKPHFEDAASMNRFLHIWSKKAPATLLKVLKTA